ncbi:uncharacterized protein LOC108094862 [Drosophila ficusphila]|uniref:uncharacterized protein LOC108094862 n=1 Tax=Drosophila ficusphila TaxID=30025 RepID=UPI0007E66E58|nr:uncharacterized protein LOC108094862 [Drosophila ficusphila]
MSEEQCKPNLILGEEKALERGGDGDGDESLKNKKRVTFNRVVEYFSYSDNFTNWKRHLMPDNDLRKSMPPESKTYYTKN